MPAAEPKARGRSAASPHDIPRAGWIDIIKRLFLAIGQDHIGIVAAGIAFYSLLAIFPAIASLIAVWGIIADARDIQIQLEVMSQALPPQAAQILVEQARAVAERAATGDGINIAALSGILLALASATRGTKSLMEGLNIVYREQERRNIIKVNLLAFGLTCLIVVGMLLAMAVIILVPAVLGHLGLDSQARLFVRWGRWPLLFICAMLTLSFLYRYAPCRSRPQWRWVSIGPVVATALWIAGSFGFSLYVRNFASYGATYGSLGAVVILLMWFFLSAFIVLLGAQLSAQMEHQTERDTTVGEPQPMGRRGAVVADTVPESFGREAAP